MTTTAQRLDELGIALPTAGGPAANYVTAVVSGDLLFLSGHTSTKAGRETTGTLGRGVEIEQGYAAARSVAIDLISTMQNALGDLDRVERIVKVTGFVQAAPDFTQHPAVINGASDLFVEVFGERGRHARAALGVASLPGNAAVEIELTARIR